MSQDDQRPVSRRGFLQRATAVGLTSIAARGVYEVLDELAEGPRRAEAATVIRRFQEQYLIDQVEVIVDNGVTVGIPPLHNDVITAKLKSGTTWTASALKKAKTRLETLVTRAHARNLWTRFYTLNGHAADRNRGWTASYNFGSTEAAAIRWRAAVDARADFIASDMYEDLARIKMMTLAAH